MRAAFQQAPRRKDLVDGKEGPISAYDMLERWPGAYRRISSHRSQQTERGVFIWVVQTLSLVVQKEVLGWYYLRRYMVKAFSSLCKLIPTFSKPNPFDKDDPIPVNEENFDKALDPPSR